MQTHDSSRRRFLRHPADVPVEIAHSRSRHIRTQSSLNIGYGGLLLDSQTPLPINQTVRLAIRLTQPPFEECARVAWCKPARKGYEIGVEFMDADSAFRARMVEQICYIESYRLHIKKTQGRELSSKQAAMEWIEKYAGEFPAMSQARAGARLSSDTVTAPDV